MMVLFAWHSSAVGQTSYIEDWKEFRTTLIRKEKSFQKAEPLENGRNGFELVEYSSDGMKLKALLKKGGASASDKRPAVVYLHGGFALTYGQLEYTKTFSDAGFVVLAPSWRGENGNPGFFELFLGEVRDAKAAVSWLARREYVDETQIYVFGWSVGGGIALNLSLHGDIPLRMSASSAGVYDTDLITSWATEDDYIRFPYDHKDARENHFRLPVYNLRSMVRPHTTYIGSEDGYPESERLVESLYPERDTKLKIVEVPGDHVSSVNAAVTGFLKEIKELNAKN